MQNHAIERVGVYVDGFNFYHGLMSKDWGRYRWLDYQRLLQRFMRDGQEMTSLKYFTTLTTHDPAKLARQQVYLRALRSVGGVEVIEGEFETRDVRCRRCLEWYRRPQEKRTDVNIARHLIVDAFDDVCDAVLLVSADADLIPALDLVQQRFGRRLILVDPPGRHSGEIAKQADAHWHIPRHWLAQSQLPDPVTYNRKGRTKRVHRPEEWGSST